LTSVTGYLELLHDQLRDDLDEEQAAMVAVIRRNLERLNELTTNLLVLARAEETQFEVESVDLRTIAAEVAADVRLMAAGRDIAVRTMQAASPVVVLGDRSQLLRAARNLATNAVKFSSPGGTVEVRVVQEGSEAVLEVVDEGIGIPASDLPSLGARFFRASNAMRAEIAGTGLGIRIVQTIMDRHDGTLSVESIEGEGTTVTLRLPISRVAPEAPLGMSGAPDGADHAGWD
jgi:two-component system OmpR family sensor kinase